MSGGVLVVFRISSLGWYIAETVRGFSGNQYLLQVRRANPNWLRPGKLVRSYGHGTTGVCMRLFMGLIGVKKFKVLLLHSQASILNYFLHNSAVNIYIYVG